MLIMIVQAFLLGISGLGIRMPICSILRCQEVWDSLLAIVLQGNATSQTLKLLLITSKRSFLGLIVIQISKQEICLSLENPMLECTYLT